MIKIRKKIYLIILIAFILLIRPIFSQENYSIENLRMYININDKGDAHVIEIITYNFYSKSNGITRSVYLEDNSKLDNLRGYEIYPNKKQLALDLFEHNIRLHDKTSPETKIYKIEYDLEDVIIKHNSADELKFKVFDVDNNNSIKNLNICIYFPQGEIYTDIRAFQHGYLYKNINIHQNTVNYTINDFPKNIELELKVLLPQAIPTYSVQNDNKYTLYNDLVNKEINIESKYKNIINRIKKINILSISLLIIEFFYLLILFFDRLFLQKGNLPRNYNLKLPTDCTPAIMASLLKRKKIKSRDFFITIADLIRKGYILEVDDKFKLTNKDPTILKNHEKYLLNWLFGFVGNNKLICLEDIKKYNKNKKNFIEFKRFYNNWKRKVYTECEDFGYLKTNNIIKFLLYLYSYFKILLGILFIYIHSPYLYRISIALIVSGFINNIYLIKSRLTRLGYIERKKWISFKKFIINFKNTKVLDSDNTKIWKTYIIYSISMRIHKELLYKLRNNEEIVKCIYFNKANDKKFIKLLNEAFRTNELDSVFMFKKSNK